MPASWSSKYLRTGAGSVKMSIRYSILMSYTTAVVCVILVCTAKSAMARSRHTRFHDLPSKSQEYREGSSIPRVLHQSWKSTALPSASHEAWRKSWLEQNPDWQLVLWTDEQNRALVLNHFPWLLAFYDTMDGVYSADLVCLRSCASLQKCV